MARKFGVAIPKLKIVNRCIMCGRVIPSNYIICSKCGVKREIIRKRLRRKLVPKLR